MRTPATLVLFLLLLVGCAQTPQTSGQDAQALAMGLPAQVNQGWVRQTGTPSGDAIIGYSVRYNLAQTGAWATVFIGRGMGGVDTGPVADGGQSAVVQSFRTFRPAGARVIPMMVDAPNAPQQECQVGVPAPNSGGSLEAACVTGAGGHYVRIRATLPLRGTLAAAPDQIALPFMTAVGQLAGQVTAAVARGAR